jgi:hypothetical protein
LLSRSKGPGDSREDRRHHIDVTRANVMKRRMVLGRNAVLKSAPAMSN